MKAVWRVIIVMSLILIMGFSILSNEFNLKDSEIVMKANSAINKIIRNIIE